MRRDSSVIFTLMVLLSLVPREPTPAVYRADPVSALFVGAIALAWVAGLLLRPKRSPQERDKRLPSLVRRGDQLAYVIGRRVVPGQPYWVGRRNSREESIGGGGKKGFGSGKKAKQIIYYEDGVHVLCLGPGSILHEILANKKPIFTGPISPDTTPSGSVLQDIEGNNFAIYWGQMTQPVNTSLGLDDALGVSSRWPFYFYIHWLQRRLGTSAVWQQLDYDISCNCVGLTLPGSECYVPELSPGAGNGGMNGAHILYQLLTGSYPHGAGANPAEYNFGSWKELGALLEAEQLPQNVLIASDTSVANVVDDILQDSRCLIVQNGHTMVFVPIRPEESLIELTDVVVVLPEPEYEINHARTPDRQVFLYPDIEENFTDTDLVTDDDGRALNDRRKNSTSIQLPTITNQQSAAVVADQRRLIIQADATQMTLKLNRTARRVVSGQAFMLAGIGPIRITSTKPESTSSHITALASYDQFSLANSGWSPTSTHSGLDSDTATHDDAMIVLEVPYNFAGEELAVAAIRVRLSGTGANATIWASVDGTTYKSMGEQLASAAGATLLEDLGEDTWTILEDGPLIAATAGAMNKVLDLSGDLNGWRTGRQLCIIGTELFYLRNISAETGGYRLHGLIRARAGSGASAHATGALVAIIEPENVAFFTDAGWAPGMTIRLKAQPEKLPLDGAPLGFTTVTGKALGPYGVDNLRPLFRGAGEDCVFTWTERIREGTGCGAGEQIAGDAIAATPPSEITEFKIRILGFADYVIRTDSVTSPTWTYTNSDMFADGVGELDFTIEITPMKGTYGGYARRWIVEGTDT